MALPPHLEEIHNKVGIGPERTSSATGLYASDVFDPIGYDNELDLTLFRKNLAVQVLEQRQEQSGGETYSSDLVFKIKGIHAPLANAFRRVLLSEIPTMAIETVMFYDNTSVVHDEILAHRLGLVPIRVDPREFEYLTEGDTVTDRNCIKFRLCVECKQVQGAHRDAPARLKYTNSNVYSGDIQWQPFGNQAERFRARPIRPVHDDILLCKMRPNQRIEVEMHCVKGIGQTHAKWSPVATAFYRMMPDIVVNGQILGDEAMELMRKCPLRVFDVEDSILTVARPLSCTMCRECIRDGPQKDQIKLSKMRDHFIFSIESTGAIDPHDIFVEAADILIGKCRASRDALRSAVQ